MVNSFFLDCAVIVQRGGVTRSFLASLLEIVV
jgi:hypothetical protein